MRLDQYAASKHPSLSRSYISRLINEGRILVNRHPQKPGYRLRKDDKVQMNFDLKQLQTVEDIILPVIYEDDNVIVINKPTGVISHNRGRYWYEPSVASFIRQKTNQEGDRAGIAHRLDRATSGVMVCAKNDTTLSYIQKQFSQRKVRKIYVAVVSGHMVEQHAIIDMPIERNPKKPQTFRAGPNGKHAITEYTVDASWDGYQKLILTPQTGRTHQIRVHLKQLGHPIVGDELYGGEKWHRLLLHASEITLELPDKGISTFTASEPDDFYKFRRESVD